MSDKIKFIFGLTLLGLFFVVAHFIVLLYTPASSVASTKVVTIERGSSFTAVASTLVEDGILKDTRGFRLASRITGSARTIQAGEFELSPSMTPLEVLSALVNGTVKYHSVTLPEGYTIKEIAAVLEKAGITKAASFVEAAFDPALTKRLDIKGPSLEGYLFPDTYKLTRPLGAEEVIKIMVKRFRKLYTEEELKVRAAKAGLTPAEVITLASIIEKETGLTSEMRTISSVFHNRLRLGIALQSDPTIIYGIKDFDGNIRKKDLKERTPYNTYTFRGLPPGPIANPGKNAIEAALEPDQTSYLYFVSRNDGSHYFSKSLKEHNRAVDKYQRWGRKGKN